MPAIHPPTTHENVALTGTAGGVLAGTYPNPTFANLPHFNVKEYGAVGNGVTDDRVAIQDACNAASAAGGGTIYFPEGNYIVLCSAGSSINLYDKSLIRFKGEGFNSIITMSPSSDTNPVLIGNIGAGVTPKDDFVFENITISLPNVTNAIGIAMSTTGTRKVVRNCHFVGLKAGAIRPAGSDISIVGNTFWGGSVGGYAILANDPAVLSNLLISNNLIDGNSLGGDGIQLNCPNSTNIPSNIIISNNIVRNYLVGSSSSGIGIGIARVSNIVISSNAVSNCYLDAIHVEDESSNVSIIGNTIFDTRGEGISVQGVVSSADINKMVTIVGNTVKNAGKDRGYGGIMLVGAFDVVDGFNISGNVVDNCGRDGATDYRGIYVFQSKNGSIVGNIVKNTKGSNTSGIKLTTCSDVAVLGNRCWDDQGSPTQDYGLTVTGNTSGVLILGNRLNGNATGALDEIGIGTQTEYNKLLNKGISPSSITGTKSGNAALTNLLNSLASMGIVTDNTT